MPASTSESAPQRPHFQAGLIIAASVLVAAGIAFYENAQVRQWVDSSRRKIALALHNLGDEISPLPASSSRTGGDGHGPDSEEGRRKRREEIATRNRDRLEREEGQEKTLYEKRVDADKSFDNLVGNDGMLRREQHREGADRLNEKQPAATEVSTSRSIPAECTLRQRGTRGMERGAAFANPFDDEAQLALDRNLVGIDDDDDKVSGTNGEGQALRYSSSETLATSNDPSFAHGNTEAAAVAGDEKKPSNASPAPSKQPELTNRQDQDVVNQAPLYASASSMNEWADATSACLLPHSAPSSRHGSVCSGTATPTEDGFSDSASQAAANDSAAVGYEANSPHGNRRTSDALSDIAFSDLGVMTPSTWTEVGSEAGSD